VELTYPGQTEVFQDGDGVPGHGTIQTPTEVEERPILQKIRIDKDIQKLRESKQVWYCLNCGYENGESDVLCGFCGHNRTTEETKTIDYAHDTYGAVHSENISADREDGWYDTAKDWFAKLLKLENPDESTESIGNFRFKAYLKSNLERLYREADGTITWNDRNGNEMVPQYEDKTADDGNYDTFTWKYKGAFDEKTVDFPEKSKISDDGTLEASNVQKIYTEVEHNKESKTSSARANNVWESYGTPQGGNTQDVGDIKSYTTSERGASGQAVKNNSSLYSYDLDTIYSVEWDSAKDGGADKDYTTLSADELHNGTYYNTSSYLPYGVYVIVEQQPERRDKDVNDWKNRSLQRDY
ncbi:MAG: zinc ribbon domain-containing protein, partial [bacterium]|nr:zinc ribbon domain-containing protein [bacterium]